MQFIATENEAISKLVSDSVPPITVIGTESVRRTFDEKSLQQAINARGACGVTDVILNPDAHCGYGAPIGCVMVSPSHIFPGPVGVDIKCSMSLLQFDLPAEEIRAREVRRALIDAICCRTPTGYSGGKNKIFRRNRKFSRDNAVRAVIDGATESVCEQFGIPFEWTRRCEDAVHFGHDGASDALEFRLDKVLRERYMLNFADKMNQLGSYGGGNHFGECEVVEVCDDDESRRTAEIFGLKDGHVAFLSHCGSRGFGNILATEQFKILQRKFSEWGISYPGNDRQLVYAPLGSVEANDYLDDLAMGANFATLNHLLINVLVLEAFREVFPQVNANLIYFISHNIVRREVWRGKPVYVHRKGATRAFPAGHHELRGTPFEATGHPILLPGNPRNGSAVMVGLGGAEISAYSINHGAGRVMGRRRAFDVLNQKVVDNEIDKADILTNCRKYPLDEAPDAYKDFDDVLSSVKISGLACEVARLKATFVIKDDNSKADD
ncbi:MAG: RtcB family protein [Planctomycetaceae bacterium]|jgi:tRNA-splicing ligase RtcB|nr:RtcB family protein [Planctomycetaceae bacterium]